MGTGLEDLEDEEARAIAGETELRHQAAAQGEEGGAVEAAASGVELGGQQFHTEPALATECCGRDGGPALLQRLLGCALSYGKGGGKQRDMRAVMGDS